MRCLELAPLHNPSCLAGIRGARAAFGPTLPMVAVFDTAFHQTMPDVARQYALPVELAERHRIRRYGFHGIAHASLANGYAAYTGTPLEQVRLITLQLGNGCSVAAIAQGRSVETSMGFTPLEGLVMGTRSGDVDASIVSYLSEREKVEPAEVERWLNERSGLLGLSGRSNDMRELLRVAEQEQDKRAEFAIDLLLLSGAQVSRRLPCRVRMAPMLSSSEAGSGKTRRRFGSGFAGTWKWCGLSSTVTCNRAAVDLRRVVQQNQYGWIAVGGLCGRGG